MSASEKTAYVSALLPQDILVEIFSKLPAKSLVRFRCVSKFFCALIADHDFSVLHRNWSLTLPSRAGVLITIESRTARPRAYYTINFSEEENPRRPGMLQANRIGYLDAEHFILLSSLDGLICMYTPNGDAAVCNVSTGQRIFLPRFQFRAQVVLGYDSESKRYKVLMSAPIVVPCCGGSKRRRSICYEYKHWVLTVGVDKSWRAINNCSHIFYSRYGYGGNPSTSVYIDGVIYFYCCDWETKVHLPGFDIVAFEVGSENISVIPFPNQIPSKYRHYSISAFRLLRVDGGRLAIVFVCEIGLLFYMDVWTWEKFKKCWEKITITIPPKESRTIKEGATSLRYTTNHAGEIVLLCINRNQFSRWS